MQTGRCTVKWRYFEDIPRHITERAHVATATASFCLNPLVKALHTCPQIVSLPHRIKDRTGGEYFVVIIDLVPRSKDPVALGHGAQGYIVPKGPTGHGAQESKGRSGRLTLPISCQEMEATGSLGRGPINREFLYPYKIPVVKCKFAMTKQVHLQADMPPEPCSLHGDEVLNDSRLVGSCSSDR